MKEVISSAKNPLIKRVLAFEKKRNREYQKKFTVEGIRENLMALANGWEHEELVIPERQNLNWFDQQGFKTPGLKVQQVSNALFEKIAYRGKVDNVVGIYNTQELSLDRLKLPKDPLILVLESIEKPGNIGAIMRTADAAGVDAIILSEPNCDIYNPNVVRSSLGTLFSLQVAVASNEETMKFIEQKGCKVCTTYLEGSMPHFDADLSGGVAIVMGSEANGVTSFWLDRADFIVKIPMRGQVDSMNVSTATAVLVYESVRQRTHKKTDD